MIDDWLAERLVCPSCDCGLEGHGSAFFCSSCGLRYESGEQGVPDLRLRAPKPVLHPFTVGCNGIDTMHAWCRPMKVQAQPAVDFGNINAPFHFTPELLSHFPRASAPECTALDLGCGAGMHRRLCELAGYRYVGVDIAAPSATLLADAHALPFADDTFDFVLSMAVLEHLQYPFIATREVMRVLRPGGIYLGTVAFLEPFHGNSFYHHTHLGTANSIASSGLEIEFISPAVGWPGIYALARSGLFPRMPAALVKAAVTPLHLLHRTWWMLGSLLGRPSTSEHERARKTAGAFYFKARKPTSA